MKIKEADKEVAQQSHDKHKVRKRKAMKGRETKGFGQQSLNQGKFVVSHGIVLRQTLRTH